eukprot:SAG11_NODE_11491_length_757_cov_0.939210_2_plen_57_part_01
MLLSSSQEGACSSGPCGRAPVVSRLWLALVEELRQRWARGELRSLGPPEVRLPRFDC